MTNKLIVPRFGIRSVQCPVCREEVKNARLGNIENLVTVDSQIRSFLRREEQRRTTKKETVAKED